MPNPVGHFDTPLDDRDYDSDDVPMDAPPPTSLSTSLGSGNPEDIQDEAALFNSDVNSDFSHLNLLQATLENLASVQTIIKQIQHQQNQKMIYSTT